MAISVIKNTSSIKVKFDQGEDLNGDRIVKSRTYGSIKPDASNENIVEFVSGLSDMQEHKLVAINRIDNTSLAE